MAPSSMDRLEQSERFLDLADVHEKRGGDRARENEGGISEQECVCRREGGGLCVRLGTRELFVHAGVAATAVFLRLSAEALAFNLRRRVGGAVGDKDEEGDGSDGVIIDRVLVLSRDLTKP